MATFKEEFTKKRKELGAGKTFTWKDKNGKVGTYSTNYAEEEKKPSVRNPNATSVTNKVKAKESVSGASRSTAGKVKAPSTVKRPAKADEISGQKAAPSLSGASRSTAGKVAPKMSMMEKAKADAKAAREKSQSASRGKTAAPAKTVPTAAVKPLTKLMQILSQGGFSKYKG
jgi:hypothetical protein